jgi:hypothetical protein
MNSLNLLNRNGVLEPDAAMKIYAHAVYPSDPSSRRQALMLAADERERFARAGGIKNWQPSKLTKAVITSMQNEAGQRAVAGWAAIAFALLRAKNPHKEHKLYAAAQVVERALKHARKDDQQPLKMLHLVNGEWQVSGQRCPSTRKGIETAWTDYCTVSHILAADMILAEWFPVQSIFERSPDFAILLMRTAAMFERHIQEAVEQRGHSVLAVAHQFGGANGLIPPIDIGEGTLAFIARGLN